jgi:hypothetical protein
MRNNNHILNMGISGGSMSKVIAIPGRPGFQSLLWWFQGPSSNPDDYKFYLDQSTVALPCKPIPLAQLGKGSERLILDPIAEKTFLLVTPHQHGPDGGLHDLVVRCGAEQSNKARAHTLPHDLATLQIVLNSCYYADNTCINFEAPLPDVYPEPHVKVCCGDQIYLDLEKNGLFPKQNDHPDWERTYALYYEQWRQPEFLAWMASCANICMGDDHEFWNNYPSTNRWPGHSSYSKPSAAIEAHMFGAFLLYQAVLNADPDALLAHPNTELDLDQLRCFEFPGPASASRSLSLFMLDTRTERQIVAPGEIYKQFCKPEWLAAAIDWIRQLQGPGLLVTGQSLLEVHGDESELADFREQYGQLMQAIRDSPHQLALLTGDIHWSRAQRLSTGKNKHVEIVASALSCITPFDVNADNPAPIGTRMWQVGDGATARIGEIAYARQAQSNHTHNFAIITFAPKGSGVSGTVRWWFSDSKNDRWQPSNMGLGKQQVFSFTLE